MHCPFCHLCIGLFQKKNPNRGLRIYFFENPGVFHFFTLTLEIPDKTKPSPWIFHRIVLDPLEIPIQKTDPWNFHIILSWPHFGNSILFLINPWNSTCYFFDTSGNSISSTSPPPCLHLLWNNPLQGLREERNQ